MKIRHFFLLLLIFFVFWSYFTSNYRIFKTAKFSSEKWQNYDIYKCERKKMLYDLSKNYLKIGMKSKDVRKILGEPDFGENTNLQHYEEYELCAEDKKYINKDGYNGSLTINYKNKKINEVEFFADDSDFEVIALVESKKDRIKQSIFRRFIYHATTSLLKVM